MPSETPDPGPPALVRFHAAPHDEVPGPSSWLTDAEAERLDAMRFTKRRDESRLGRWTAKHAVARSLGLGTGPPDLRRIVIRNDPDGAPRAFVDDTPAGVAISMTDRADWAVCAVAADVDALGCDLELVEPRSPRFVADWFTTAERAAVDEFGDDRDLVTNLVWSAKESALKVLHEGLRLDTRMVEVTLSEIRASGWSGLTVTVRGGPAYPGWWAQFGDFVLTCCAPTAITPPDPMDDPSPLAAAVPSHRWMAAPIRDIG